MSDSGIVGGGQEPDKQEVATREQLGKLGLLVAGIAHNLYGPLTGILGTMDLLKLKFPDLADDFERVGQLGHRLQDEIRVMLYKAEIESRGVVAPVDLRKMILNELEFYKGDPRLKHMIEVKTDLPEDLPAFIGVPADFLMAFSNILTNAIEAMSTSENRKLVVSGTHDDETIVLKVKDSGIGMDSDTLAKAFDPFFTTKEPLDDGKYPATLATGLGLTHAKVLLDDHGVEITLDSAPDKGCTVTVAIPYKQIQSKYHVI
ncbi:HAMP domain-containing histidine kinase [bacterium]|nr:HAMP domain-containing histidine kinase [bacterium]